MHRAWRGVALGTVLLVAVAGSIGIGQSDLEKATVTGVHDGDTFTVELNGRTEDIRIGGVDTPESDFGMCFADEATAFTRDQINGEMVWIRQTDTNRGRIVADVYLDPDGDDNFAETLVARGFAVSLSDLYALTEESAMEDNAGLWGDCFIPGHRLAITSVDYQGEVVTILNRSDQPVRLDGWTLYSSPWGGRNQQCPLPDVTLFSGDEIRVHNGSNAVDDPPGDVECNGANIWLNGGDSAWLVNDEGKFVDHTEYKGGYGNY